jgi:hypothetical protein
MTDCPPEIAAVLLEILKTGLLAIRAAGWSSRADRCALEADHLHNLPQLPADYRPQLLLFYWDVERADYVKQMPSEGLAAWEPLWRRLEPHVEAIRSSTRLP